MIDLIDNNIITPISKKEIPKIGDVTMDDAIISTLPISLLAAEPSQEIMEEIEIELEHNTFTPIDNNNILLPYDIPRASVVS